MPASPSRVEGSGGDDTFTISHSVTTADRSAASSFATHVTDARAGWLGFMGVGIPTTTKVTTTTTHTQSQELAVSGTVATSLELHAVGSERYSVGIFYDRVFGGFAFRKVP